MLLEEAINTALVYERKVCDVYADAVESTQDTKGKRVLEVLAREEQDHVAYLERALEHWKETGQATAKKLQTALPPTETVRAGIEKLRSQMSDQERPATPEAELAILAKALDVETETSNFYKRVVGELDDQGQALFAQFVQIEEGHKAIVQAEIDAVQGTGYWFDFREFDLEAA
jgi:rubrerythrin